MPDLRFFLPKRLPTPLITAAIILVALSWLPLTVILKYTQTKHEAPRIALFQDMGNQPRLNAQAASPIFLDGRAMRPEVEGTVDRGALVGEAALVDGYTVVLQDDQPTAQFITGFPEGIEVDSFFLARGKEKFDTFCYPCHGKGGYGNGPVNLRASGLALGDPALSYGTVWVSSANLHNLTEEGKLQFGAELYPNGRLYHTIAAGKGNMAGYAHSIPVEDRWAIVAYVRALQLSQHPDLAVAAMDAADGSDTQTALNP